MSHGLISHSNGSELLIRRETCRARRLRTCLRYHFHVTEQAEPPCVNQEAHEVKNEQPGSSQAAVCLPDGGAPRPPPTRTGGCGQEVTDTRHGRPTQRPAQPAPADASGRFSYRDRPDAPGKLGLDGDRALTRRDRGPQVAAGGGTSTPGP